MRNFIIGDIHGCSGAFVMLLEKLDPDPGSDILVLLGDLFDRGPDSWQVFQTVKELKAVYGERLILLLGNHEDYLLQPHLSWAQRRIWERVGRQATVRSFQQHGEQMEDAAPWIREHAVMYYKTVGFQCVHAGIVIEPPEMNDAYTLLHDHEIVLENRYTGTLTVTGHIALPVPAWFAGDGKTVKELAVEVWEPLPDHGVICIDTGCGKGGALTAMVVEGGRYCLTGVPGFM